MSAWPGDVAGPAKRPDLTADYAPPLVVCQECRYPTDPTDLYNFRGLVLCPDCMEDAEGRLNPEEAP